MPKAASPIRLEQSLMEFAVTEAKISHRSAAEQVEYWADLGRRLSGLIESDTLLSISAGLARVRVEPVEPPSVAPATVFAELESDRNKGALSSTLTQAPSIYQASTSHPGYLECIEGGQKTVGQFKDGEFIPLADPTA